MVVGLGGVQIHRRPPVISGELELRARARGRRLPVLELGNADVDGMASGLKRPNNAANVVGLLTECKNYNKRGRTGEPPKKSNERTIETGDGTRETLIREYTRGLRMKL